MKKYIIIVLCCFDCNKFINMFLYYGTFEQLDEILPCLEYNYIVYDYDTLEEVGRY